jgi:hypothetical protein
MHTNTGDLLTRLWEITPKPLRISSKLTSFLGIHGCGTLINEAREAIVKDGRTLALAVVSASSIGALTFAQRKVVRALALATCRNCGAAKERGQRPVCYPKFSLYEAFIDCHPQCCPGK